MDGNGRWARKRGLPRIEGHRQGVESVRKTVAAVLDMGIPYLTLFSFSSENWSRPPQEVEDLMGLLRYFVRRDLKELHDRGVKVRIIGSRQGVAKDILALLDEAESLTRNNSRLHLTLAFNYGGRDEILRAARRLAQKVAAGNLRPEAIDYADFAACLDTQGIPDPDLLIRTSGEKRLSNFLLWQCAYSELIFLDDYWPDFDRACLEYAIREYQNRERRFGGLAAQ